MSVHRSMASTVGHDGNGEYFNIITVKKKKRKVRTGVTALSPFEGWERFMSFAWILIAKIYKNVKQKK